MGRIADEKQRVADALLETERQKVKILINSEKALDLRARTLASIEALQNVGTETAAAVDAAQRAMPSRTPDRC